MGDNPFPNEEYEWIRVPKSCIPKDAELMECYRTTNEIIVCGQPAYDDESHNCDEMGCSSINHVLYRFKI
jgi:hypothetical protein